MKRTCHCVKRDKGNQKNEKKIVNPKIILNFVPASVYGGSSGIRRD